MFLTFLYAQIKSLNLLVWALPALFAHGPAAAPKRLLIFCLAIPLLICMQGLHWLGFLLDELLYRQWRQTRIRAPVFIIGIPRSGTTFLQRTLARDTQFATTRTWETLLAPSITEKKLYRGVAKYLRPLLNIAGRKDRGFVRKMAAIHQLGLNEPEEDFLFLLNVNACFLLVALYPSSRGLWKLSRFDQSMPPWEKTLVMKYYQACVRKQLYFIQSEDHGCERVYLSKNPSFTPMAHALRQTFPDAKFIVCVRDPIHALPSQISALRPAFALLANGRPPQQFIKYCVTMLHFYYQHLTDAITKNQAGIPVVNMVELQTNLSATLASIYRYLERDLPAELTAYAERQSARGNRHQSQHRYTLEDFGLDDAFVRHTFNDVWPIRPGDAATTIQC